MSCVQAMGVAEKMKEKFGEKLDLKIFTTDSKEAEPYDFKSSTNVLLDGKLVPVDIATDEAKMEEFLSAML